MKVIALYDFQAQPDSGEISITKDEIITVTRQDIGEGWWEGINSRSQKGLFPAEYVTPVVNDEPEPPLPPPPPPHTTDNDAWNSPKPILQSFVPSNQTNFATDNNNDQFNQFDQQEDAEWGDDDWDDDDSQVSEFTTNDYSPSNPPHNQLAAIHIGGSGGG